MKFRVEFERIGRRRNNLPVEFEVSEKNPVDDLADKIHTFTGKILASREFTVMVDLNEGIGDIDGGRFGTFTIDEVPA